MSRPAYDLRTRLLPGSSQRHTAASPLLAVCGLLVVVSLVFLAVPRLDLTVSRIFYDPAGGYDEYGSPLLVFLREIGGVAVWMFAIAVTAPLLIKFLAPESRLLFRPRVTFFALATWGIGPGLIVNGLLKSFWGRARPRELVEFGGEASFSPVWWISDQCGRNCSFVSGEAASAFWLVALVFVVPKAWRLAAALGTLALAAGVSFARVAAGGHFVSDVVIAWLLTLLVMVAFHRLILRGLPPGFDHAVEAGLSSGGRAVRQWWAALRGPLRLRR